MLDILTIVHSFSDIHTAAMIRCTCRKLGTLIAQPKRYDNPSLDTEYEYRVGNNLHRLDGPARLSEGFLNWYRGGIRHREYHPQCVDGYISIYMVNDEEHREFGPSSIYDTMTSWYWRGLLHRKTGPADTCYIERWYTLGNLHRLDAPVYYDIYAIRGKRHSISNPMNSTWRVNDLVVRR